MASVISHFRQTAHLMERFGDRNIGTTPHQAFLSQSYSQALMENSLTFECTYMSWKNLQLNVATHEEDCNERGQAL